MITKIIKDTKINTSMIQNADRELLNKERELILHSLSNIQITTPIVWIQVPIDDKGTTCRTLAIRTSYNEIFRKIYGYNCSGKELTNIKNILQNKESNFIGESVVRIIDPRDGNLIVIPAIYYLKDISEKNEIEIAFSPLFVNLVLMKRNKKIAINPLSKIKSKCGFYVASYVSSLPENCGRISFRRLWNSPSVGSRPMSKRGEQESYKIFCRRICKDLRVIFAIEINRNCKVAIEDESYIFQRVRVD
jgi:hypothetical protein